MNRTLAIAMGFIVVAAIGGFVLLGKQTPTSLSNTETEAIPVTTEENKEPSTLSGAYNPYTKSAFEETTGKTRVLFFYANWCPVCKPIDAEFQQNSATLPDGLTIFRVNYNDSDTDQAEKELAKKYGITYQHTFVQVDAQGNEITKWNGGGLPELKRNIQK